MNAYDRPPRERRSMSDSSKATYGIDAPLVLVGLSAASIIMLVLSLASFDPSAVGWGCLLGGTAVWVMSAVSFGYATTRGKFEVWKETLGQLGLRGDERVLDLGCGRGAVLIACAQLVPTGQAVGIDLWRTPDQSGNAESVTRANAVAEGVSSRIELVTGDMQSLPFVDDDFDVIVSSLAIHNIPSEAGRAAAVTEALRVVRPGGRILIADFKNSRYYVAVLERAGAADGRIRKLGWRFWFGGPWFGSSMAEARKRA